MIFNMVGGGAGGAGGGATLVVSSPANVSVTVSKDDKSYTKNSGDLGSTTFKGLATGTWTVTINGNGQTATRTIEITADYAITIAFFSAYINITYPATSTCIVQDSSGQIVASDTNATNSSKTWTAPVNSEGFYTIIANATDGSQRTTSKIEEITADGQVVSTTLSYRFYIFSNESGFGVNSEGVAYTGWEQGYAGGSSRNRAVTATEAEGKYTLVLDGWSSYYTFLVPESINMSEYSSVNIRVLMNSDATAGVVFGVDDGTYKKNGGMALNAFQTNSIDFATLPSEDIGTERVLPLSLNNISERNALYLGVKNVNSGQGFTIYDIYLE